MNSFIFDLKVYHNMFPGFRFAVIQSRALYTIHLSRYDPRVTMVCWGLLLLSKE